MQVQVFWEQCKNSSSILWQINGAVLRIRPQKQRSYVTSDVARCLTFSFLWGPRCSYPYLVVKKLLNFDSTGKTVKADLIPPCSKIVRDKHIPSLVAFHWPQPRRCSILMKTLESYVKQARQLISLTTRSERYCFSTFV